jgi:hypothetical protein
VVVALGTSISTTEPSSLCRPHCSGIMHCRCLCTLLGLSRNPMAGQKRCQQSVNHLIILMHHPFALLRNKQAGS